MVAFVLATLPGMWERTITVGSGGKAYSATGWKVQPIVISSFIQFRLIGIKCSMGSQKHREGIGKVSCEKDLYENVFFERGSCEKGFCQEGSYKQRYCEKYFVEKVIVQKVLLNKVFVNQIL